MKNHMSFALTLILSAGIIFASAAAARETPFPEDSDDEQYIRYDALPAGSLANYVRTFALDQPAEEIVQNVYAKSELLSYLGISDTGEIMNLSSPPRSLVGINRYYPIECIRQITDSLVYVVYRLEDGGKKFNAYFFFEKVDPSQTAADSDREVWWLTGRILFSCLELSYDDFSSVGVGSPASDVAMIDPVTQTAIPENRGPVEVQNFDFEINDYVEETVISEPILAYTEYHLLTDGILCITYSRNDAEQEFAVSSTSFNETFEVSSNNVYGTVKFNILPIDYPKQIAM